MQRRDFLIAGAGLAAGALLGADATASPRPWPPFADMLAIDGASGTNLVFLEKGGDAAQKAPALDLDSDGEINFNR